MDDYNMSMVAGDTLAFAVEIEGQTGNTVTGATFCAVGDLKEGELAFEKTLGNGITYAGQMDDCAVYNVSTDPEDTEGLEGIYYYQLKLEYAPDVFTILKGILKIERSVGNV